MLYHHENFAGLYSDTIDFADIMTFTLFVVKEKAEILQQVDSLTQIKDELTSQVASLTTELEKERSTVHSLQKEHSKAKVIS